MCNNGHLPAEGPQQHQTVDSLGGERGSCKKGCPEVLIQSKAQRFGSELLSTVQGPNRRSLGAAVCGSRAPALPSGSACGQEKGGRGASFANPSPLPLSILDMTTPASWAQSKDLEGVKEEMIWPTRFKPC